MQNTNAPIYHYCENSYLIVNCGSGELWGLSYLYQNCSRGIPCRYPLEQQLDYILKGAQLTDFSAILKKQQLNPFITYVPA